MNVGVERCPSCHRVVSTCHNLFGKHSRTVDGADVCFMSKRRTPIRGNSDDAMRARAHLVCDLASQLRDLDPVEVWDYLATMPTLELRRLLVVALAGIEVEDRTVVDVFRWVTELPVARLGVAS